MIKTLKTLSYTLSRAGIPPTVLRVGLTWLIIVLAQPAAASTVTFALPFNYGDLTFGAEGPARIVDQELFAEDGGELNGFPIVGGTLNFSTGPLLEVTPFQDDAFYRYAEGGGLALTFDLLVGDAVHHGTFAAPLVGPYLVGFWETSGTLGVGAFDAATAALLGISPFTRAGPQGFYLDLRDTYPAPFRLARSYGYLAIETDPIATSRLAAVPEPSLLILLAGGVAISLRRRLQ